MIRSSLRSERVNRLDPFRILIDHESVLNFESERISYLISFPGNFAPETDLQKRYLSFVHAMSKITVIRAVMSESRCKVTKNLLFKQENN